MRRYQEASYDCSRPSHGVHYKHSPNRPRNGVSRPLPPSPQNKPQNEGVPSGKSMGTSTLPQWHAGYDVSSQPAHAKPTGSSPPGGPQRKSMILNGSESTDIAIR